MNEAKPSRATTEAHYKDGKWTQALAGFDLLLENGVSDGNLLHDRAVCIFQLGRQKEALQELDKAVILEPSNPYRYASRAWIRAALKDVDGAIEDYNKALELDPDDAITLNNLGLLEEQYGMRKAAQERFKKADTLMGILKDAGVDPAEQTPNPPEENSERNAAQTPTKTGLWKEVKAVFTEPGKAKDFFQFLRNGMRT